MKNEFLKTKEEISNWLNEYKVNAFTIEEDLTVNVYGDVDLKSKDLDAIPIRFNKVDGYFDCNNNKIISLEFGPRVVGGYYRCSNNQLTSLEFCPMEIGWSFNCSNNKIATLEFSPVKVGGSFYCSNNKLTSLKHVPENIGGVLNCSNNKLTTLVYFPEKIGGWVNLDKNKGLGEFQFVREFEDLYIEHRRQVAEILENKVLINKDKDESGELKKKVKL